MPICFLFSSPEPKGSRFKLDQTMIPWKSSWTTKRGDIYIGIEKNLLTKIKTAIGPWYLP